MSWSIFEGLADLSCGGLLVVAESSRDPDLAAFVGDAHLGKSFLVLPLSSVGRLGYLTEMEREEAAATGLSLLDSSLLEVERARARHGFSAGFWSSVLRRGLEASGLEPTTMAVGGRLAAGISHGALSALEDEGWRFIDGRVLLLRYRKRKSGRQAEAARRAASGVCAAMTRAAAILAATVERNETLHWEGEPLSAGRLRREISVSLASGGLDQPEGNIVAAGAAAGVPHTKGSDERILESGETIVIDLFPKGELFADLTRTFVLGEPSATVDEAHRQVVDAVERAHREARVGRCCWELQQLTCDAFSRAGFATPISHPGTTQGYVHGLGHGVGFELHEYPSFAQNAGDEGILELGDVFTLEPGLYDADAGYGVRLEDLCLVTETGIENLTPLPYEMNP
ncbi:MAG: aminopeptidase P family protein, partial [Acidobacteriota bacterium]|nr:aminopeptidase P family protein [Acidobacteriota bacterium]